LPERRVINLYNQSCPSLVIATVTLSTPIRWSNDGTVKEKGRPPLDGSTFVAQSYASLTIVRILLVAQSTLALDTTTVHPPKRTPNER
jgi:hypothetical protein